jgi:predicted transposase YdaD
MLGLNLEESQIYQEVKQVGRLEREAEMLARTVPLLLKAGMSIEDIAEQLNVGVDAVRKAVEEFP